MRSKSVNIKVDDIHKQEIEAELYLFQKGYKARTINVNDVLWSVEELNKLYKGKVPMKLMNNTRYVIDVCAQRFPNKYMRKGRPYSTQFEVKHNGKCWMLTGISRDECDKNVVKTSFIPYRVEKRIRDNAYKYYEKGGWS